MFIPAIFVAAHKGKLPRSSPSACAKVLQVCSCVRQLCSDLEKDPSSFAENSFDKSKAGRMYANVSPGNMQFVEALLNLNDWSAGPVVEAESVADIYLGAFLGILHERFLDAES